MKRTWTKELVGVLAAVLIVCVASAIVRTCFPEAAHGLKISGSQWQPLGPWDGGVNTAAIKSAVAPNQLIDAENFVWTPGGLEVREGFYRFASPQSGRPVEWLDIFKTTQGSSYLMYSDGEHLWYRPALIGAAVELNFGRSDSGRVNAYTGLPWVHGKTISGQKWRTALGTLEGGTITVDGVEKTIELVVLDTLVKVTEDFGGDLTNVNYNMDVASIDVGSGFQVSNNYWINTNVGKFYFSGPGQFTIVDSLTGVRYQFTGITRVCSPAMTLKLAISGLTENFGGRFARLVTNPISRGSKNDVDSARAFYMSYPVYSSGSSLMYLLGVAFPPDTGSAQYVAVEEVAVDTASKVTRIVDSIQVLVVDSTGYGCSENYALYLKVYCDTCNWSSESFLSGDYFVSPQTVAQTIGGTGWNSNTTAFDNTIIASRVTTPNQSAVKAHRIKIRGVGSAVSSNVKAAIYKASDSTLVDTTLTYEGSMIDLSNGVWLNFVAPVDLLPATNYFVAVWGDSIGGVNYNTSSGAQSWTKSLAYTGTFPATITTVTAQSNRVYNITADLDYWSSTQTLMTSAYECLPVVGGFVDGDSAVLIAIGSSNPGTRGDLEKTWNRMRDPDTTRLTFFRMKREAAPTAVGIDWAVWHNGANFEVRSSYPDRIYWSEVNQPDSFLVDHVLIVDHGNALIAGGKQYGDLIVYTATNRWKIINGGGGAYGRQYMDGARGCIARGSFLDIDGVHYGLAADGFWESSGEAPVIISQAVESWFRDSLDYSRLDEIAAGYDAENNNIWISFPPNHTLVYNRDSRSWWPQSWRARAYAYNPDVTVSDTVRFIAGGVDSSTIFVRGGTDDDGDSIVATLQTPYMDFGVPQLIKRWRGLRVGYEADRATAFALDSYRQFSGTAFDSFTGSLASGWSEKWLKLREGLYRGKNLSQRLTLYDASGLRISSAQVEVKAGGEE